MSNDDSTLRTRLARNLAVVREKMAGALAKASRAPDAARLIAVSKQVGVPEIQVLWDEGVRDFGEARMQDAEPKIKALNIQPHWHLIGHLQTNKSDKAAKLFNLIHSLDSLRLAQALNKEVLKIQRASIEKGEALRPLSCLIEVNVAEEASKGGVKPELSELAALLGACASLPGLRVTGLMTMAPLSENPEPTSRPVFQRLRTLLEEINAKGYYPSNLAELSMGMTQDYPIAIEEGATLVRVGTALFQ